MEFQCKAVQGNLKQEVTVGFGGIGPLPKRRPSTMSSLPTVGIPQNSMAETLLQIPELQFDKFHNPTMFLCWQKKIQDPGVPMFLFSFEGNVMDQRREMVDSLEDLRALLPIKDEDFPDFEMLDAASGLNRIIQNPFFKKKISLEEQNAQKENRFLRGRQIAFMIYDYFRVTGAHDAVLDYADLLSLTLRNDNVQEFDTRWDEVLLSMAKKPTG